MLSGLVGEAGGISPLSLLRLGGKAAIYEGCLARFLGHSTV